MPSPAKKARRYTHARRERMAKALDLRKAGANYREIGKALRISHTQAANDVRDALEEVTREPAEEVLQIELGRLDDLYIIAFSKARNDKDMKAVDSAVKLMDRRAKYLGLDNPTTSDDTRAVATLLDQILEGAPEPDA